MACAERTVALVLKVDQPQQGNKAQALQIPTNALETHPCCCKWNCLSFLSCVLFQLCFRVWRPTGLIKPTGFACPMPSTGDRISQQKNSIADVSPDPQLLHLQTQQVMNLPLDRFMTFWPQSGRKFSAGQAQNMQACYGKSPAIDIQLPSLPQLPCIHQSVPTLENWMESPVLRKCRSEAASWDLSRCSSAKSCSFASVNASSRAPALIVQLNTLAHIVNNS